MAIIRVPNKKKMIKLDEDFDFGTFDIGMTDDASAEVNKEAEELSKPEVEDWLVKHGLYKDDFQLEATGGQGIAVDVMTNLDLSGFRLYSIPDLFFFRYVKGNCNFANNMFTDWRYFPQQIMGDCLANFNKITSFDGAPAVNGYMTADRQRVKTFYKLDDRNYHRYRDGENLMESLVYLPKEDSYGYLTGISENKKSCSVKLTDGKTVTALCEEVDVVDGLKYLKSLWTNLPD